MSHNHNPIDAFKTICIEACKDRKACTKGYKDLLKANSAEDIAVVWRKYWTELVSEQYADRLLSELPAHYADLSEGFNKAGVFFNECPVGLMQNSFVIIGNNTETIHIYGHAVAYVIGKATVIAHDHSIIHSAQPDSVIELLDHSTGHISAGTVTAYNHSTLYTATDCTCFDSSQVHITKGTLHDHGHYLIKAYNTATIHTFTHIGIILYDRASIINNSLPLPHKPYYPKT